VSESSRTAVLFVCLGNICRSPLAEGVFRHLVRERGLDAHYDIDSAGTGSWHVGAAPDPRSTLVAERNGVLLEGAARQVRAEDVKRFDWIIAMDRDNRAHLDDMLEHLRGDARVSLLRDFDPEPEDGDVPDPYYGGPSGFDDVYVMVRRATEAFLDHLEAERTQEEGMGRGS